MFLAPMMPLITIAKDEDPRRGELFEQMVLKHQKRLFGIAYSILEDHCDAEDAVQNTFVKVWKHFDDFEGKSEAEVKALFIVYVSNAAKDVRRTKNAMKNHTVSLSYDDEGEDKTYEIPDPYDLDSIVLANELSQVLINCISKLKEEERQILSLRYYYHYSSKKIAEVMNITVGNVNVRMKRAKARLYRLMEEYINE